MDCESGDPLAAPLFSLVEARIMWRAQPGRLHFDPHQPKYTVSESQTRMQEWTLGEARLLSLIAIEVLVVM